MEGNMSDNDLKNEEKHETSWMLLWQKQMMLDFECSKHMEDSIHHSHKQRFQWMNRHQEKRSTRREFNSHTIDANMTPLYPLNNSPVVTSPTLFSERNRFMFESANVFFSTVSVTHESDNGVCNLTVSFNVQWRFNSEVLINNFLHTRMWFINRKAAP